MNRLAIHESAAGGLSPTNIVDIAQQTGFDSIGVKVAHSAGADRWWRKGAGSPELATMVEHLLTRRVSVLDVGRVELGGAPNAQSYRGVLDLGSRFGARFVTAGGVQARSQVAPVAEQFAQLVADADDYQLIPLLVAAPGTEITSTAAALEVVRRTGGGVVITAGTNQTAFDIESQVLDTGNHLGYLRLLAEDLDGSKEDEVAGLLATVPVHIPIAVGSHEPGGSGRSGEGLTERAARWSVLIDRMLEHPLARASRLRAAGQG